MNDELHRESGRAWFRVDTGTHTASIVRLVADPRQRAVFTVGLDKRVRRWSEDGEGPQATYVGEIGPGDDGRIIAAALHPDHHFLIVAVHRAASGTARPRTVLRIFDVASAHLLESIPWPTTISDLVLDPSGGTLYCVGAFELGAYDLGTLEPPWDPDVTVRLDAPADRVALGTTDEGVTRLFVSTHGSAASNPLVFDHGEAGFESRPFLHPDPVGRAAQMAVTEQHLAVSPRAGGNVDIHDLDGRLLHSLKGAGAGRPEELAFSPSGDRLIVGSGNGQDTEVTVHDSTRAFRMLGSRRYNDDAPAVALLDDDWAMSTGGRRFSVHAWPADHVGTGSREPRWEPTGTDGAGQAIDEIGLSGNLVAVGHRLPGLPLSRVFDLDALTYTDVDDPIGLDILESTDFAMSVDEHDDRYLSLNASGGVSLNRDTGRSESAEFTVEQASVFGFLPDGRVAIGDRSGVVHLFDPDDSTATARLLVGHQGPVTNLAAQGNWLATVGDDQIVRLWSTLEGATADATTNQPALNLFFTADGEWVIWSRSGYYAASQNGDKHISYHVNRGEDEEALVLPADRFLSLLYRPELIREIWAVGSESIAVANLGLEPPDVEAVLPPHVELAGEPTISADGYRATLEFTVTDLGPATTRVWLLHNGLPVWEDPLPLPAEGRPVYTVEIDIEDDRNTVRILAENPASRSLPVEWRYPAPADAYAQSEVVVEAAAAEASVAASEESWEVTVASSLSIEDEHPRVDGSDHEQAAAKRRAVPRARADTMAALERRPDERRSVAAQRLEVVSAEATEISVEDEESPIVRLTDATLGFGLATSAEDGDVELAVSRDGTELWSATAHQPAAFEITAEIPLGYGSNEIEIEARTDERRQILRTSAEVASTAVSLDAFTGPIGAKGPVGSGPPASDPGRAAGPVTVAGPGADPTPRRRPLRPILPNLYVLAIGVSNLKHEDPELKNLQYAANDATAISDMFRAGQQGLFGEVVVKSISDEHATRQGVLDAMDWLQSTVNARHAAKKADRTKARDVTMLFLSGHGITRLDPETKHEDFYFVSHDFHRDRIPETGVRLVDLGATLSQLPTELVVLIDACRSGWAGADFVKRIEPEALGKRLHAISERAQYLVSSTSHNQLSYESTMRVPYRRPIRSGERREVGHGLFTHAILKKLNEAKRGESVAVLKLTDDIQAQLDAWTSLKAWAGYEQTPKCRIYGDIERVEIFRR